MVVRKCPLSGLMKPNRRGRSSRAVALICRPAKERGTIRDSPARMRDTVGPGLCEWSEGARGGWRKRAASCDYCTQFEQMKGRAKVLQIRLPLRCQLGVD